VPSIRDPYSFALPLTSNVSNIDLNPIEAPRTSGALWHQGWYRFAKRIDSPHFDARPPNSSIDLVVIHSISLPPGVYEGNTVIEFLTGQPLSTSHPYLETIKTLKVSAHFFIRRGGELVQMVSCDDKAWHAGVSHYRGRDQCNNDSIGIELEGLEGQAFEPEQYETLGSLCAGLLSHYPVQHFAGHEHIAPERKKDPGAGFLWGHFQKSLGLSDRFFPNPEK